MAQSFSSLQKSEFLKMIILIFHVEKLNIECLNECTSSIDSLNNYHHKEIKKEHSSMQTGGGPVQSPFSVHG
jgi:hypothetical protein